jgi:hypothetical protein
MSVEQGNFFRAIYWRLREKYEKQKAATIEREIHLANLQLLTEIAAQQNEILDLLKRSVGLFNCEEIALQLDKVFRERNERLAKVPLAKI